MKLHKITRITLKGCSNSMQSSSVKGELLILHKTKGSITILKSQLHTELVFL